eukprot:11629714-Prorocentrum_lima.AAC.1
MDLRLVGLAGSTRSEAPAGVEVGMMGEEADVEVCDSLSLSPQSCSSIFLLLSAFLGGTMTNSRYSW